MEWRAAYLSACVALAVTALGLAAQSLGPWLAIPAAALAAYTLGVVLVPSIPAPGKVRTIGVQVVPAASRPSAVGDPWTLYVQVVNGRVAGTFAADAAWLDPEGDQLDHPGWALQWLRSSEGTSRLGPHDRDQLRIAKVTTDKAVIPLPWPNREVIDQKMPLNDDDRSMLVVRISRVNTSLSAQETRFRFVADAEVGVRLVK
jgi:hypothetical protein